MAQKTCVFLPILKDKESAIHTGGLSESEPAGKQRFATLKSRAEEDVVVVEVSLLAVACIWMQRIANFINANASAMQVSGACPMQARFS